MRTLFTILLFVLSAAFLTARADSITFNLTAPTQTGAAGQTVSFEATVNALVSNTETIYLDALNVNALDGLEVDTDDFYNYFPLSLAPGESFTGRLFIAMLNGDLPSDFDLSGLAILQGRVGSADQVNLASSTFSVNAAVAPEPSTLCLLSTGVLACIVCYGRRSQLEMTRSQAA